MSTSPADRIIVDVTYTDRSRAADGRYNVTTHPVAVTLGDGDPTLIAAQIVGARIGAQFDGMVLDAVARI